VTLLLDTHLLIWAAQDRLSPKAAHYILDAGNILLFSPASIWEIIIKNSLHRPDFNINPTLFRRGLRENGYEELPISSLHTLFVADLPSIHKDPFDRILIAQSRAEVIPLLTADPTVAEYRGSILLV
jgi:PIN domain nuclease of toxin-antitoxin system